MYTTAVLCGAASWILLNRYSVRGDYVLAFYICASTVLYYVVRLQVHTTSTSTLGTVVTLLATYFTSLSLSTICYRLSPWHPLAQYPGPISWKISSLVLSCVSLTGRRHFILDRLHRQYGPYLRVGPNLMSINSPSAYSIYLTMEKGETYRRPDRDLKVTSLFFKTDTEKQHRERKKIWAPLFTPSGQIQLLAALEKRTWELMQCLEKRQFESGDDLVELKDALGHWSFDFMGDMVFGGYSPYNLMKNGDVREFIATGKNATGLQDCFGLSPWLMDILWRVPISKKMRELVDNSKEMTHNRLAAKTEPGHRDLMSYWVDAGLPTLDIEHEALIATLGGSDNTYMTLSLAFYFMLSEPQYYRQLQAELDIAFRDPTGPLPPNDLLPLPFLNAIVNETLRLSSPYFITRVVPEGGVMLDGNYIAPGTTLALAAYSQQTSEENFYPDPHAFRPERWLEGGLGPDTKTNKGAIASFSFGPHACVAKNFAYQELRFVLARLVLAYDMALPQGFDVPGFRNGILNMRTTRFKKNLHVHVTRRAGINLDRAFSGLA